MNIRMYSQEDLTNVGLLRFSFKSLSESSKISKSRESLDSKSSSSALSGSVEHKESIHPYSSELNNYSTASTPSFNDDFVEPCISNNPVYQPYYDVNKSGSSIFEIDMDQITRLPMPPDKKQKGSVITNSDDMPFRDDEKFASKLNLASPVGPSHTLTSTPIRSCLHPTLQKYHHNFTSTMLKKKYTLPSKLHSANRGNIKSYLVDDCNNIPTEVSPSKIVEDGSNISWSQASSFSPEVSFCKDFSAPGSSSKPYQPYFKQASISGFGSRFKEMKTCSYEQRGNNDFQVFGEKKDLYEMLLYTKFKVGFIDSHCHLDFLMNKIKFRNSFQAYISYCEKLDPFPVSYEGCISVFCKPESFQKVDWWSAILSDRRVWGAFGCHPHFIDGFNATEETHLRHAMTHGKVKALGEIGLDYSNRNNNAPSMQKERFVIQLKIAMEVEKPVVIHCRDAFMDCFDILKKTLPRDYLIHYHCFKGDWAEAKLFMDHFPNLHVGFTCFIVSSSLSSEKARFVAQTMPLDRILLETDAPYFRPYYLKTERSWCSHPGMAIHVAAAIADLRAIPIEDVLRQTRQNTQRVYGI